MSETRIARQRDAALEGVVAHRSSGGFGDFHRLGCPDAPRRGEAGVRDIIHGPWRYLAAHWRPCPRCQPPADAEHELAA
jgi:methylphosphotriester-DNA--protein-cysteine methyltransferase